MQSCIKQETITTQAQLKSDTSSISNFVKSNNPAAIKVNTGFWYSIDDLGNGVYPVLSDTVTISYTVKLIPESTPPDLKEADLDRVGYSTSSTLVPLSKAISGLQQALILFPANTSGRIYIPSGLAFGTSAHYDMAHDTSQVSIPPNANLLYEIKLTSVKTTRLTNDISAIDSYLQTNSLVAEHDTLSGIRYTIEIDSTKTKKPALTDSILVTYSERILNADTVVTSVNTPVKIPLKDQITAWRIMLPKYLSEGATITMYAPSGYVYGSSVKGAIPANSNMVYIVTLIQVN